jgi:predicted CXXCH cytochrome family protein
MKKDLKNNRRLIHNFKCLSLSSMLSAHVSKLLALSSMLLALLILCWILFPNRASSGPYLDSAHGNTTYGVNRSSLSSFNYSIGNCAHCHEQHASINGSEPVPNSGDNTGPDIYLLFKALWVSPAQSKNFCFGCHIGLGSCESETGSCQSGGQVLNYSYSNKIGGDTSLTCPNSIFQSFQFVLNDGSLTSNCGGLYVNGSSHMLRDIRGLLRNRWGFSNTGAYVNPCSGCHNPHRAQRGYPTSLPSTHADLLTWNVWGYDTSERMNAYTPNYWAPKRVGGGYEPDGSLTQDGSNLADYVTLCTDCHNSTTTINSTRLGRNLYRINWSAGGDFHGGLQRIDNGGDFSGTGEYGDLLEPYKSGGMPNYVLSCTDCHEPHGSPNEFLLRHSLNGTSVGTISGNGLWFNWCQACHSINLPFTPNQHLPPVDANTNCFQAGACHRHCDPPACGPTRLF